MPMFTPEFRLSTQKYFLTVLILLLIPSISYGIWFFYPNQSLNVLVVDKSVPNDGYQEHQSIFWVLEHNKFITNTGDFYKKEQDYYGFFPDSSANHGEVKDFSKLSDSELEKRVSETDVIFLADTYGVYENNFNNGSRENFSKKIYGGLDATDIRMLREAVAQEKTVIAEFNSMASPTPKAIRAEFENIMGLKWTGWISRYFDEMDTLVNNDIPKWFVRQYRMQHNDEWVSPGPGLIFVREDGKVESLTFKTDYLHQIPLIRTQRNNKPGFNLPEIVPYPDWFDIVMIERDYEVISYYDINPTPEGLEKLREMGLPRFFPAAVSKNSGKGSLYYFAGDFSDQRTDLGSARFTGLPFLWRGFHVVTDYTDRQSFFWNYYYPLTSKIFKDISEGRE